MEDTVWGGLSWCPPKCVTGPQDTFLLCSGKEAPGQGGHHKRKHGSLPPSCLQRTWGSQGPKYRLSPRASLAVVCPQGKQSGGKPAGTQRTPPTLSAAPLSFCVSRPAAWRRACVTQVHPLHMEGRRGSWAAGTPPQFHLPVQGGDGSDVERRNVGLPWTRREPMGPVDGAPYGPRRFALRNFPPAPSNHPFSRTGS